MDAQKADEIRSSLLGSFLEKKHLTLTVEVEDLDQAEQLAEWFYAKDKPINLNLIRIAWDEVSVSKEEGELIEKMREVFGASQY